jgi:hypothetical protein
VNKLVVIYLLTQWKSGSTAPIRRPGPQAGGAGGGQGSACSKVPACVHSRRIYKSTLRARRVEIVKLWFFGECTVYISQETDTATHLQNQKKVSGYAKSWNMKASRRNQKRKLKVHKAKVTVLRNAKRWSNKRTKISCSCNFKFENFALTTLPKRIGWYDFKMNKY